MKGIYVAKDVVAAKQIFEEAARKKEPGAMYYNAYFILKNAGEEEIDPYFDDKVYNEVSDILRYVVATDKQNSNAYYYLGYLYQNGFGVDHDFTTAARYFKTSVEVSDEKNSKAMFKYGAMLFTGNGLGGIEDKDKAVDMFEKAARLGDKASINALGVLYERGDGVSKNPEKARENYLAATRLGDIDAKYNLGSYILNVIFFCLKKLA